MDGNFGVWFNFVNIDGCCGVGCCFTCPVDCGCFIRGEANFCGG